MSVATSQTFNDKIISLFLYGTETLPSVAERISGAILRPVKKNFGDTILITELRKGAKTPQSTFTLAM